MCIRDKAGVEREWRVIGSSWNGGEVPPEDMQRTSQVSVKLSFLHCRNYFRNYNSTSRSQETIKKINSKDTRKTRKSTKWTKRFNKYKAGLRCWENHVCSMESYPSRSSTFTKECLSGTDSSSTLTTIWFNFGIICVEDIIDLEISLYLYVLVSAYHSAISQSIIRQSNNQKRESTDQLHFAREQRKREIRLYETNDQPINQWNNRSKAFRNEAKEQSDNVLWFYWWDRSSEYFLRIAREASSQDVNCVTWSFTSRESMKWSEVEVEWSVAGPDIGAFEAVGNVHPFGTGIGPGIGIGALHEDPELASTPMWRSCDESRWFIHYAVWSHYIFDHQSESHGTGCGNGIKGKWIRENTWSQRGKPVLFRGQCRVGINLCLVKMSFWWHHECRLGQCCLVHVLLLRNLMQYL